MSVLRKLLTILAVICTGAAVAQNNVDLRIDSLNSFALTINKNQPDTGTITIHNDSLFAFKGYIRIGGTVNGQQIGTDSLPTGALYDPDYADSVTIAPGSSVQRFITLNTSNASYIVGSSGVVIWPIAVSTVIGQHVTIADSLSVFLTILYPVGVDEIADRNLRVYIESHSLVIQDNGNYPLKDVQLFDLTGDMILQKPMITGGVIDMSQYAEGIYFAAINFADNTRAVVKIVNLK